MSALAIIGERRTGEDNNNVWLAGVMSNGLIVGNSTSASVQATSFLSAAKTKDTVSKDLVDRLMDGPPVISSESPDLYSRYVREFGTNPDNLSSIVRSMSMPAVDTLRYIRAAVSDEGGQDYRLGFIEDDDLAGDLLFSSGLIEDLARYLSADTDRVYQNDGPPPGKTCRHCGLGWVTHSDRSMVPLVRALTSGLGMMGSHFTCGRRFWRLSNELRRGVSSEMLTRAFVGLVSVLSEGRSIDWVEDRVRLPVSVLVSTPVKVQLYPGRSRENLILWHMQNAIANTIIQGSERHATSDEEISLFQSFISKYGFDLIGQKSQAALRRLEACTNLNKLARKEVDAYIGPTRNQLPFNIQRSETLYWAWSNVTYELTRPVERRVSQRVASGTRGGANTHGSMTTNFESTTERDNRVENHGTGYLGITDKALYFVATTPGGQSVEVPFDRLLNFRRNSSSRVGFQESARQGDARHPRSFSGADAWEIDMAFRTLTRSAEVTDDERRQAWRDLSPPVQSLSHNENEDASSMSYLESIRKGTREGWGKGYRFGRGR